MATKQRRRPQTKTAEATAAAELPNAPQPAPPEPTGAPIELDPKLHYALGAAMVLTAAKLARWRAWSSSSMHWPQDATETPWYDLPKHFLAPEGQEFRKGAVRAAEMFVPVVSSDQFRALSMEAEGLVAKTLLLGTFSRFDDFWWYPTSCTEESFSGHPEVLTVPALVAGEVARHPELELFFDVAFACQYEKLSGRVDAVCLRVQFENLTWNGCRQWAPEGRTPWEQARLARYERNAKRGEQERAAAKVAPEVK
jgi:hypothetical protein